MLYIVSLSNVSSTLPIRIDPTFIPSNNPINIANISVSTNNNTNVTTTLYVVISAIIVVAIIALFASLISWYTQKKQCSVAVDIEQKSQNGSDHIDCKDNIGDIHPMELTIEGIPKSGATNQELHMVANIMGLNEDEDNNEDSMEDLFKPGPSTEGATKYIIEDLSIQSLSDKIPIEFDTKQTKQDVVSQDIDTLKDGTKDVVGTDVGDV